MNTCMSEGPSMPQRQEDRLPLVYDELRKLAAKMALKLPAKPSKPPRWCMKHGRAWRRSAAGLENRAHFFAAAAESMRRILICDAPAAGRPFDMGPTHATSAWKRWIWRWRRTTINCWP